MSRRALALTASLLAPLPLAAFDQTDAGIYAIVHVDGHVTEKVFRVSRGDAAWKVEDRKPDGSWEDVSCTAGCIMVESSAKDVERFLGQPPKGNAAECIHNSAFAICRATDQAKPDERQYLFVALTEQQPIVLRLAPQAPQGSWRDSKGRAAPDTESRKSVNGFAAWVLVTPDADWKEKWETPASTIPHFTQAKTVERGKQVFVLTFLANPMLTAEGQADVTCDIDLLKPDGTAVAHQAGVVCLKGPVQDPKLTYLAAPVVGFVGDPGDPSGVWVVHVTLMDKVRNVSVPLSTSFELLDK